MSTFLLILSLLSSPLVNSFIFSASPIPILPPRWSKVLLAIEESLHTSAIVHGLLDVFDTVFLFNISFSSQDDDGENNDG